MKSFHLVILTIIIFPFFGCATTYKIPVTGSEQFKLINEESQQRAANVTLNNGRTYWAREITVKSDSTIWYSADRIKSYAFSTNEIDRIEFNTRKGLRGFAIGAASGLVLGFTLPYWEPNTDCSSFRDQTILGSCGSYSVIFGTLGFFLGGAIANL